MVIENKELGVKIADQEEALWLRTKEATEQRIKGLGEALIIETAVLETCNKKLKKWQDIEAK